VDPHLQKNCLSPQFYIVISRTFAYSIYMTCISWSTVKEACTSSHYDILFIALHNFVNLTVWAEILKMLFTCFQSRAQEKNPLFYSIKHNKTQIGVSLKNSTIPLLQNRDLEFSKGLTLMSETCVFLRKPSPVKLPGEIILQNESLGTLRSRTLHRDFFSSLTALEFPPALSQIRVSR